MIYIIPFFCLKTEKHKYIVVKFAFLLFWKMNNIIMKWYTDPCCATWVVYEVIHRPMLRYLGRLWSDTQTHAALLGSFVLRLKCGWVGWMFTAIPGVPQYLGQRLLEDTGCDWNIFQYYHVYIIVLYIHDITQFHWWSNCHWHMSSCRDPEKCPNRLQLDLILCLLHFSLPGDLMIPN